MQIPSSLLKTTPNKLEKFDSENAKIKHDNANESDDTLPKNIDKVSFSNEGIENYRKSVSEKGQALSYDGMLQLKKNLVKGVDYSYNLSREAEQLNEKDKEELADGGSLSWQKKAENLAKAYTNCYDEIVQGYENGTRQVNVIDENSELGYRALTKEEELSALDAAYEKTVKGFNNLVTHQQKAETIIGEWQKQIADIKSGKSTVQPTEEQTVEADEQKEASNSEVSRMLSVIDSWKATYTLYGKNKAWENIASMFNTMFK